MVNIIATKFGPEGPGAGAPLKQTHDHTVADNLQTPAGPFGERSSTPKNSKHFSIAKRRDGPSATSDKALCPAPARSRELRSLPTIPKRSSASRGTFLPFLRACAQNRVMLAAGGFGYFAALALYSSTAFNSGPTTHSYISLMLCSSCGSASMLNTLG